MIRRLLRDIPRLIHLRAEQIRAQANDRRDQLHQDGASDEHTDHQVQFDLAWADFLDALVRHRHPQ